MKPAVFLAAGVGLAALFWARAARAAAYVVPQFTYGELMMFANTDGSLNLTPAFKPAQDSASDGVSFEAFYGDVGLNGVGDWSDDAFDWGVWATEVEPWGLQTIAVDPVLIPEDELNNAITLDVNGLFNAVADWLWDEEAFVSYIYDDATGQPWKVSKKGNPTIGVGHLVTAQDMATYGPDWTLTEESARALLLQDINKNLAPVLPKVTVPLTLKQWIAITSLAFNAGGNAVAKSSFLKAVNAGDMQRAEYNFKDWDKATVTVDGKKIKRQVRGLTNRRAREWAIFVEPAQVVMLA